MSYLRRTIPTQHVLQEDRSSELTDEQLLDFYLMLPKNQRDDLFADTARAAEIVDLTQRTIQLWIDSGFVRAVMIGKKYKVSIESLRKHLRYQASKKI